MSVSDNIRVKSIWGNYNYEYVESLANGRSGGIISIWDPNVFLLDKSFVFENFVVTKGSWVAAKFDCFVVNIYAPQSEREKLELWNKMVDFMNANKGNYVLCGDFNSTRNSEERMGSSFSLQNASNFNDFISRGNLIDLKMGRHKFTRISPDGLKASRLDRFLVNKLVLDSVPDLMVEALDDIISDHRPLLLKQKPMDFGPSPFKFFNSWITIDGFDKLVKDKWGSVKSNGDLSAFNILKHKLKCLKFVIKAWNKERLSGRNRENITREIAEVDGQISNSNNKEQLAERRKELSHELRVFNLRVNKDMKQQAKVKWALEGDENSKYFHAIINAKRKSGFLKGVKHNGVWIDQPLDVRIALGSILPTNSNGSRVLGLAYIQFLYNPSVWTWNWRRDLRDGHEQNQLQVLLLMLPNTLESGEDYWSWNLEVLG
ncbi:cytochrome P450 [Artemisia annua]|uniref:Cytochrome P450 n=1 Tax=Artemisia annua TaxID=35608 RepID=A0A2U1Q6V1_ARTAN|nr:cytochrome P450 [Artemisia annua]